VPTDIPYDTVAAPFFPEPRTIAAAAPLGINPYQRLLTGRKSMETKSVSWGQLVAVLTILSLVIAGSVGGGFAWMHGDIKDIRSDIAGWSKEMAYLRGDVGKISGQLEILIQQTKH
jgi:hypothetical protein